MADNRPAQLPTGGRDDLRIDASRCTRMRYSGSSCRRCAAVCPNGAVGSGEALSIKSDRCTGCLLCTTECPVGALEQGKDFSGCLAQLSRVPEPILGCIRTSESSHATLACLGGLSQEHLVTLCHSLSGKLTLNLSACSGCPNDTMIPQLQQRLRSIAEVGLSGSDCSIVIAESARDLSYKDETVDRRSFFKAFRRSVFKSAAVILSTGIEQAERRTEYSEKRLPIRRELLNRTISNLPQELKDRVIRHFGSCISFDQNCTTCQGCVAICPTGALKAGPSDIPPVFDQQLCTGCGLCREFCLDGALQISSSTEVGM